MVTDTLPNGRGHPLLLHRTMNGLGRNWRSYFSVILLVLIIISVGILRVYYCAQLPVNTGDVLRHMYYGLLVNEKGLGIAAFPLREINAEYAEVAWSRLPYNYPIVTLLFFRLVAKILPTVFFAKLALTLLEAVNSVMIFRYSKEKWLALIYWASPVSIWWVSHEGQFEPLQNFFVLIALCLLSRRRFSGSLLFLAIAIQVKLSAIFLLPLFVYSIRKQIKLKNYVTSIAVGFVPTMYSVLFFPVLANVLRYSSPLRYNPYYWNLRWTEIFLWTPKWLLACSQISSYLLLAILVTVAFRNKNPIQFLAPAVFLVTIKVLRQVQFWYVALLQPLLLPIRHRRLSFLLFLLTPLLDLYSAAQIIAGPFGYVVDYFSNMTAFTIIRTLQ